MQVRLVMRQARRKTGGIQIDVDIRKTPLAGNLQRVPGLRYPQMIKRVEDGDGDWYRWAVYFQGTKEVMEDLVANHGWRLMGGSI